MSKLRDILIDRMVGDMSQIMTLKNASKKPEELTAMTMPKIEQAEGQIRALMIGLLTTARTKGAPLTWLESEINKL